VSSALARHRIRGGADPRHGELRIVDFEGSYADVLESRLDPEHVRPT